MGKIVRGAQFEAERFLVSVPTSAIEQPVASPPDEFDERFAAPFGNVEAALAPPPEPQIDWEAVTSAARDLIDRAAADAEAMLNDAAESARKLAEEGVARAGTVETEARSRGYDDGFNAGKVKVDGDLAETVASLHAVVEEARAQRNAVIEAAEPEIVRLAMSIAERVIHDRIAADPEIVVQNVKAALTRLVGREVVTLRVNPLDLEAIRAHRDEITGSNDVERLRILEDQRVDRGGVMVETDAGTIDAKISTQIREARRLLTNDDLPPAQAS